MEIIDTRHKSPDTYDFKDISVGYDWSTQDPKYVQRYLTISLDPRIYARDRFEGQSFEKKKHGARQIKIYASEMQKMIDALNLELAIMSSPFVRS